MNATHYAKRGLTTAQTYLPWALTSKVWIQREVRRVLRRPAERDFRALPLIPTCPTGLHLDVGANRGQSIDAIRLYRPTAQVIALEPNYALVKRLRRLYAGDTSTQVLHTALSDKTGQMELHVPVYNGFMFDGLASLDAASARDWLEKQLYAFDESKLEVLGFQCSTVRLDDMDLEPAFVKMDIQGHEHRALLGATETLRRCRPILLIEAPSNESTRLLADLGYTPWAYTRSRLVSNTFGSLNTYFIPTDS